jgi:hypothetical protein
VDAFPFQRGGTLDRRSLRGSEFRNCADEISQRDVLAQKAQADYAGVGGDANTLRAIEQHWEPRLVSWK